MSNVLTYTDESEHLIAALREHKFNVTQIDCSGEIIASKEQCKGAGTNWLARQSLACDEGIVRVKYLPTGETGWVFVLAGNSTGELVCDYSYKLAPKDKGYTAAINAAIKDYHEAMDDLVQAIEKVEDYGLTVQR